VDSLVLKTEALCWLRFGKKMELVCTEGGYWQADVLGITDKFSIEVEIKVSKSDLKREFVTKKVKHFLYNSVEQGKPPSQQTPNYFYFYVPKALEEEALKLIEEHSPKAGLAVYDPVVNMDGKKTRIARRPTKLHDKEPTARFKRTALLRMGSELCGRYVANRVMVEEIVAKLEAVDQIVVDMVKQALATTDIEEENGHPEERPQD
jgi:hypothetical protein